MRTVLFLATFVIFLSSCSEYQKVLGGTDLDKKANLADKLYQEKNYVRALPLYEELRNVFRGANEAQLALLRTAYCEYYTNNLNLAAFRFRQYFDSYPYNSNAEEALYMQALCLMELSPRHSLDQSATKKALITFQLFVNRYPNSEKVLMCNQFMDALRLKQENKEFERAALFHKIEDYKAAVWALNNFMETYPGSAHTEMAMFLSVEASFFLAELSIPKKQKERYDEAIDLCRDYKRKFPNAANNKRVTDYMYKSQFALKNLQ